MSIPSLPETPLPETVSSIRTSSELFKFIRDFPRALSVTEFRGLLDQLTIDEQKDFDKLVKSAEEANVKANESRATANTEEIIKRAVNIASRMWKDVKELAKSKKFLKLGDREKVSHVEKIHDDYAELIKTYPIVTKYMIVGGRYSKIAFSKFLERLLTYEYLPKHEQPPGYMHDQWLRRQADYIRYLWCEYNRSRHISPSEHQRKWEEAYENFKGEFDKMQKLQKETEEFVTEEKKARSRELLTMVTDKLTTQPVDNAVEEAREKLLRVLRAKVEDKARAAEAAANAARVAASAAEAAAAAGASGAATGASGAASGASGVAPESAPPTVAEATRTMSAAEAAAAALAENPSITDDQ